MPNGHDKNFVRLCLAIEGFHDRYGHWPTRVRLSPGVLDNLRSIFSADDFEKLSSKIELAAGGTGMVAEDDAGGNYSYGEEPRLDKREHLAQKWLGVHPREER